ncbi:MAG: S8 family serine peptidase [Cytophagales bacterium]|nr:S8 family serine peptidase [Cytophagales bacterium]MDW8383818.1 S8 family serine peptidase [Flammeovirgaceae bacterium]
MSSVKYVWVLFFLLSACNIQAQKQTFLIFLKDKGTSSVHTFNFDKILTKASIERRKQQNIHFRYEDLPIWKPYRDSLLQYVKIVGQSKWLNAIAIEATTTELQKVRSLPFVLPEVILLKSATTSSSRKMYFHQETFFETPSSKTYLQNSWIGVSEMHRQGLRGEGVTIAVFDNGFANLPNITAFRHLFDNNRIVATYNFVQKNTDVFKDGRHGTQVLSILAAHLPDSFIGIVPSANYILCTTEENHSETKLEEFYWLSAAEFADSLGAHIISSSLGYNLFDDTAMNYQLDDLSNHVALISRAAELASQVGILVINSAGNEGNNKKWRKLMFPADAPSVIAVAAANRERKHANFSSWGYQKEGLLKPELAALGDLTAIVDTNGKIGVNFGTSFACPQVAGLAAGLWQAFPTVSSLQIRQALLASAERAHQPDTLLGYGIPNFRTAYRVLASQMTSYEKTMPILFPTVVENQLQIAFPPFFIGKSFDLQIFDAAGKRLCFLEGSIQHELHSFELPPLPVVWGTAVLKISPDFFFQTKIQFR